jgi:hypothetical protein
LKIAEKIDLGVEPLDQFFERFAGMGNFLALGCLSSDRSFDKGYSQNGMIELAIIYDFRLNLSECPRRGVRGLDISIALKQPRERL